MGPQFAATVPTFNRALEAPETDIARHPIGGLRAAV